MKDLIEALNIFLKYGNQKWPTHCEHDVLQVCGYSKEKISLEDRTKLESLGFFWDDEFDCWTSFKYGSC